MNTYLFVYKYTDALFCFQCSYFPFVTLIIQIFGDVFSARWCVFKVSGETYVMWTEIES